MTKVEKVTCPSNVQVECKFKSYLQIGLQVEKVTYERPRKLISSQQVTCKLPKSWPGPDLQVEKKLEKVKEKLRKS